MQGREADAAYGTTIGSILPADTGKPSSGCSGTRSSLTTSTGKEPSPEFANQNLYFNKTPRRFPIYIKLWTLYFYSRMLIYLLKKKCPMNMVFWLQSSHFDSLNTVTSILLFLLEPKKQKSLNFWKPRTGRNGEIKWKKGSWKEGCRNQTTKT